MPNKIVLARWGYPKDLRCKRQFFFRMEQDDRVYQNREVPKALSQFASAISQNTKAGALPEGHDMTIT